MSYVRNDKLTLPPRWWRRVAEIVRPVCPHCDGEGGSMQGYYEPEFDECDLCNTDGCNEDAVTHVWRWQWWLFQWRERRKAKRLDKWVDAEVARERELRYGANPEIWQ